VGGLARAFGAELKPLWLREELQWAPDLDELKRLVTPKTRLIAICNPNNPTGAVLEEKAIEEICAVAAHAGAWLLSDEVYRGAELDGRLTPTFYGRYERVLCTGGLSKSFGLPGLRVGWVVTTPEFADTLWGYHDYTTIAPTVMSDRLATRALAPARRDQLFERTRHILRKHYPVLRDWAGRHRDLLTHIPPAAGAIAYFGLRARLGQGGWNTAELAEALRVRKSVLLVPGEQFEMPGYLRIGYGYESNRLRRALERVDELLAEKAVPRAAASD
ncbi:MAG: aminotransferase class I/II-fold pyridoxal phosphate-dependent enzyme, partial [Candidatus Acidiferrales bacterium]